MLVYFFSLISHFWRDFVPRVELLDDAKCALNESGPSTNRLLIVLNVIGGAHVKGTCGTSPTPENLQQI